MPATHSRRAALALLAAACAGPLGAAPALAPQDLALVEKARDYLRGISNAIGRFTQTDPAARVTTGTFYLSRPGRARFDYDPPSGLVVASNGFRVAVLNRRLGTLDAYPLGATPLGVLLSRDIRIDKNVEIGAVKRRPGGFSIIAHRATKKNEGQIALDFSDRPIALTGWSITDPQGGVTRVRLADFAPSRRLPNAFFELSPSRPPQAAPKAAR
ncbi:MAG: LolA family protein [Caulobacteraceae bacterium]